jgi:hypothetical protein
MDEYPSTFDANHNQFISYLWTGLPSGPQCRFKYTVTKDICIKTNGMKLGAKCMFVWKICRKEENLFLFQSLIRYVIMENKVLLLMSLKIKMRLIT